MARIRCDESMFREVDATSPNTSTRLNETLRYATARGGFVDVASAPQRERSGKMRRSRSHFAERDDETNDPERLDQSRPAQAACLSSPSAVMASRTFGRAATRSR